MKKFTYIICHMNCSEYRQQNLITVIKYLRQLYSDEIEIIVSEQGLKKSNIKNIDNHFFYKNDGLFTKAKLCNEGSYLASTEKIIFADNDIILAKELIDTMISKLDSVEAVNPYKNVIDMDEQSSKLFHTDLKTLTYSNNLRYSLVFAGGVFGMTKHGYFKLGGFDERYIGWGGEDDGMSYVIEKLCSRYESDAYCYHLYHDRVTNGLPYHEHYDINCNITNEIRAMNYDQLIQYCLNKRTKFEKLFGEGL